MTVLQIVIALMVPIIVLWLEPKVKLIQWVSSVMVCYLAGLVLANQPFLPIDAELSNEMCGVTVALAIPLLLYSVDVPGWLRLAKPTVISFLLCLLSVFILSVLAFVVFHEYLPESAQLSGMLIGTYTGGTPNLAAIGRALNVEPEVFMMVNSADIVIGGAYVPFMFMLAGRVYGWFLPPFPHPSDRKEEVDASDFSMNQGGFPPLASLIKGLGLTVLLVGTGVGAGLLAPESVRDPVTILALTSGAIGLSFVPSIRHMKGTTTMGNYFLLVFCVAIGTTANIEKLMASSTIYIGYVAFVMIGAVVLHLVFCALLRLDRDTVLITSTAAIYGPAFIGPVAMNLKNREIIVSGMASGLVGYAIGNYLGLFVTWILS